MHENLRTPKELVRFLQRSKIGSLQEERLDYDGFYGNQQLQGHFHHVQIGGRARLKDDSLALVLAEVEEELTPKSSKKRQYELAKRLIKDENLDGALCLFYNKGDYENAKDFRFSFVKENVVGPLKREYTDYRRYTYFVSQNQRNRTFADRVGSGDFSSFDGILETFSVEPLNKAFYADIDKSFTELLQQATLPHETDIGERDFVVRLLGRTLFCWFLKHKTGPNGEPLVNSHWLSQGAAKAFAHENYYTSRLEPLFFEILNQKIKERKPNLPEGHEKIPFLNGGLFEKRHDDFVEDDSLPNKWFVKFFGILEKYNFTIDENSQEDVEVGIDPEMLGTIFENLLSARTGTEPIKRKDSDKKATGSYYTPREVVNYMTQTALLSYLSSEANLSEAQLKPLFRSDGGDSLPPEAKKKLVEALCRLRVLDPACGSGAFPIGMLHAIVKLLNKLDPKLEIWEKQQLKKLGHTLLQEQISQHLPSNKNFDYACKLGVLQDTIYGADIQPIAVEITRLRCFLSLIIDASVDPNKKNLGIEALPNLDFKFVSADTLKPMQAGSQTKIFLPNDLMEELRQVRKAYLQSHGEEKKQLRAKFEEVKQKAEGEHEAKQLADWKPFEDASTNWFDSELMFGHENFHIVIGNPPYGAKLSDDDKKLYKNLYEAAQTRELRAAGPGQPPLKLKGNTDTYVLFIDKGLQLTSPNGNLTFIVPLSVTSSESSTALHHLTQQTCKTAHYSHYGVSPQKIFQTAKIRTAIGHWVKGKASAFEVYCARMNRKHKEISIEEILNSLCFQRVDPFYIRGRYPKISEDIETEILKKLWALPKKVKDFREDFQREAPQEKLRRRSSAGEAPQEKLRRRSSAGEAPQEKLRRRSSAGETQKFCTIGLRGLRTTT